VLAIGGGRDEQGSSEERRDHLSEASREARVRIAP
jgi:hypothetical protein